MCNRFNIIGDKKEIYSLEVQTDEFFLKGLKKKIEDDDYYEFVDRQLRLAYKQKTYNKNMHFSITNSIIFLTGATTVVNAFVVEGSCLPIR